MFIIKITPEVSPGRHLRKMYGMATQHWKYAYRHMDKEELKELKETPEWRRKRSRDEKECDKNVKRE